MDENHKNPLKEFEGRWKDWGKKAPGTAPEEAVRRIMARLPVRSRRWGTLDFLPARRYLAAAAAVVFLVFGASYFWNDNPTALDAPVLTEASIEFGEDVADAPVELGENVALIWLDPDTPLYLTLNPPEAVRGESP